MALDPEEAKKTREELRRTGKRFDGAIGIRVTQPEDEQPTQQTVIPTADDREPNKRPS